MATVYEDYKKVVTRSRMISKSCDWCRDEMPVHPGDDEEMDFTSFEDITVDAVVTERNDEAWSSGHDVGWKVEDLCPACGERLKQLLLNQGVRITEVNRKWGKGVDDQLPKN